MSNSQGGSRQGASTITQQVAKNFLLTNERSIERKLKEALLARIENLDEEGSWVESAGAPYDTYLEPEDAP